MNLHVEVSDCMFPKKKKYVGLHEIKLFKNQILCIRIKVIPSENSNLN